MQGIIENEVKKNTNAYIKMLYDSNYVLNMDNNELLKKIRESKFIGYRLGDVVLNYPCARETYVKGCYLINKKKISK